METSTIRIDADLLIPGRGEPIRDGTLILDGDRIRYAGPRAGASDAGAAGAGPGAVAPAVRVPVAMPGLWDAHAHFMGLPGSDLAAFGTTRPSQLVARATRDMARTLDGGVTSVRELVGFGLELAPLVDDGTIRGPRIHGAGRGISQTGGHGDLHMYPDAFMRSLEPEIAFSFRCDGVAECLRGVRLNLRAGAKVIKVMASGGVMSEVDHPRHQQFSDEELRAIVEEAARAERIVAAHCHGKAGIMAALRAGVRTIEHGTYLDAEAIDVMLEKDAILVPTRFVVHEEHLAVAGAALPRYALAKMRAVMEVHRDAITGAIEAGVRILAGCDIFEPPFYGQNGAEIRYLIELGMSPLAAIEAMTANGPLALGPQAPRSGLLAEGFDADVIALDRDPLLDPSVWGDPAHVTHVWQLGRLVKATAGSPVPA